MKILDKDGNPRTCKSFSIDCGSTEFKLVSPSLGSLPNTLTVECCKCRIVRGFSFDIVQSITI